MNRLAASVRLSTSDKLGFPSDALVFCALSSVVEHYLHTVGVAGSKPAARTILIYQSTNIGLQYVSKGSGINFVDNSVFQCTVRVFE